MLIYRYMLRASLWLSCCTYTTLFSMAWGLKVYIMSRMMADLSKSSTGKRQQRDWKGPGQGPWWPNGGLGSDILPTIETAGPIGSVERDQIQTDVWKREMETYNHSLKLLLIPPLHTHPNTHMKLQYRMCYLCSAVDVWVSLWFQPDNLRAIQNIYTEQTSVD